MWHLLNILYKLQILSVMSYPQLFLIFIKDVVQVWDVDHQIFFSGQRRIRFGCSVILTGLFCSDETLDQQLNLHNKHPCLYFMLDQRSFYLILVQS